MLAATVFCITIYLQGRNASLTEDEMVKILILLSLDPSIHFAIFYVMKWQGRMKHFLLKPIIVVSRKSICAIV